MRFKEQETDMFPEQEKLFPSSKNMANDILISGTQADVNLDEEIKYQFKGFGFDFGTKGGIDYKSSFQKADFSQLIKDIRNLPVKDYDLVINDFEPVTAWACKLRRKNRLR
jgi:hypothetical protein